MEINGNHSLKRVSCDNKENVDNLYGVLVKITIFCLKNDELLFLDIYELE